MARPRVGEKVPGVLQVPSLNGEHAGKTHSPASAKGRGPAALVFADGIDDGCTAQSDAFSPVHLYNHPTCPREGTARARVNGV